MMVSLVPPEFLPALACLNTLRDAVREQFGLLQRAFSPLDAALLPLIQARESDIDRYEIELQEAALLAMEAGRGDASALNLGCFMMEIGRGLERIGDLVAELAVELALASQLETDFIEGHRQIGRMMEALHDLLGSCLLPGFDQRFAERHRLSIIALSSLTNEQGDKVYSMARYALMSDRIDPELGLRAVRISELLVAIAGILAGLLQGSESDTTLQNLRHPLADSSATAAVTAQGAHESPA